MRLLSSRHPYQVELSAEAWRGLSVLAGEEFAVLQEALEALAVTAPLVRPVPPAGAPDGRPAQRRVWTGRYEATIAFDDVRRLLRLVCVERAPAPMPEAARA